MKLRAREWGDLPHPLSAFFNQHLNVLYQRIPPLEDGPNLLNAKELFQPFLEHLLGEALQFFPHTSAYTYQV
ncbi:hypothetical protein MYX78_08420 [Acidobacteria bacterium AH-259-G07]|nr:hypothetical protein [Acidobacteria bacterium AH-259-G07]